MRITRDFKPMSDRYGFDFGPCSTANGFAQIDTRQDASYYGTWCSPAARTIVNYCEGDVTTTVCDKHDLRHSFASRAVAVGARACSGLPGAYSPAELPILRLELGDAMAVYTRGVRKARSILREPSKPR